MPPIPQAARDETLTFLRAWFAAPGRIGAQWPSGCALSRAMAAAVDPRRPGPVVELGPGTGPVTRALLERGIVAERLVLVESNAAFCRSLRRRYPRMTVICGDAFELPRAWRDGHRPPPAAVVSSLPLLMLKPAQRLRLLRQWLTAMTPDGRFVQFTYGFLPPVPLRAGMAASAAPRVWRNLWPARVWCYSPVAG
ncbi:MAG: methyltransferase domain-containing protein [Gammaproteobacteria bacterium]|nr:methyltransferase domain-containing protein [Gammaproteobacteria bacterium]